METNNKKEPLISIFKRNDLPKWKAFLIRLGFVVITFIITMLIFSIIINANPIRFVKTLWNGAFMKGSKDILPWKLLLDVVLLLGFGMAIVPPFKMKYWNMGAAGQVMIGAMCAMLVMYYLGDASKKIQSMTPEEFAKIKTGYNVLVLFLMLLAAIVSSVIWAVIPAIFKAFFKTNETLFSLMMNYIAGGLVVFFNNKLTGFKSKTPGILNMQSKIGWLPTVINTYFLPIIIIIIITVIISIYMFKTKHGYEINVLGDSPNTARYVGMKTKWITIRTLILSGIITGIIGFLYISGKDHSVSDATGGNYGFTGVLVAWLSNFNPLIMAGVSFFIGFLSNGTAKVSSVFNLGNQDLGNIFIGIVFFLILISEFIIRYKIKVNIKKKVGNKEC